jgi:glycosyltransferase involved in cell wall biosynthesis
VVVLSSVFPNRARPTYGVFVRERVRHVAAYADTIVVAPVPWFPLNRWIRGREYIETPLTERHGGLTVYHPRYLCIPGVGKCLDGALYFVSLLPFLAWLSGRQPFDIIDAHFTYPDGVGAMLLGKVLRRPVIVTVRGRHDVRHAGYVLRRLQIRAALRAASGVIAVSGSLQRFAAALDVASDKLRVIRNGVDRSRFFPSGQAAARKRLGLPENRTLLLSVGGLVEGKGHHRIVEALPALVARQPDLLYVILGSGSLDGRYRRALEERIVRRNLADHVRLVPSQPHAAVPLWLAAADLFCLATRSEGCCNAIMEALACGLPVVTTRVGGNPELVRDGRDGLLVPFWDEQAFRDAVLRALATSWDREEIARRAAANGWDRVADEVLVVFRQALDDRPKGSTHSKSKAAPDRAGGTW